MRSALAARKWRAALVVLAFAAAVTLAQTPRPRTPAAPAAKPTPASPANAYVDPTLCATCHQEIAETYAKTGMGRSFHKIDANYPIEPYSGKPFYHEASDSYFSMVQHDGKTFQRRWQIGYDGRETNVEEKSVDYVLGSGNHGRTYLHLTARNGLQQLPLGWYSENGGTWAMLPGFDRPDYPGSERPVHYECFFCHNAYPKIPKANEEDGAEAVYQLPLPNGIDCQRCHGPGERHIRTVGLPNVTPEQIRASIVNPARLTPEREMEDCMQCHLETSSLKLPHSLKRPDRLPFSYIPGQPLENFELAFDREPGKNQRFEVANAAYALRKSQCFLQTQSDANPAKRMRCTTCHDPHNIPRGQEAVTHYNGVCRTCHAADFAATMSAGNHPTNPDCISCHMPKTRTDDAIHIVMTQHFIQRVPPANPLAMKSEYYESDATSYRGEVVPYYPPKPGPTEQNELDIAVAQVKDGANLKQGIPRLAELIRRYHPAESRYYTELAEALHTAGDRAQSEQYFNEALRRAPNSTIIMLEFANAELEWQQFAKAEATLRRAVTLAPRDPVAWGLLGQSLFQQGKGAEAKAALNKALSLDPDLAEPHNYLAAMLVSQGDLDGAEREFRAALRILPGNVEWQANLAGLLASRGSVPEARYLFERAIKLKPDALGPRINYARLLANVNLRSDALAQAQAAVKIGPDSAPAHEVLGVLLADSGDADGGVRELEAAVRLQPDFWRAHYELGATLANKGDIAGATAQLRQAAGGNDPQAKAASLDLLQRLPH
ncbi:MAG TPA: tetratricopeptide repeat protein [Bryobacteraceae bacterium]|nr:tetratricopeptide repeat protein [Bryobacteraceae bacterium]